MLVLSRKLNDKIVIDEDIVISIVEIDGDRVKIGIEAPTTHKIMRAELLEEVKSTNMEAAQVSEESVGKLRTIFSKNS